MTPTRKKDFFNRGNRPADIAEIQEGLRQVRPGFANGGPLTPTEEIMMMGQRADVPMGNPQAPAPQDPMVAPQDPMAALMGNEMALGEGGMERSMPEEAGMSIEQDAGALAEAVVGRAEGNIEAAVAILDTAKAMLIAGGQEQQMPIMAADGKYIDTAKDAINQYYNPITPINRTAQVVDRALGNIPVVGNVTGALADTTGAVSNFGRSLLDRETYQKMLGRRNNKEAVVEENIEDLTNTGVSGMKTGGKIPKYAGGGLMSAEEARRKLNEYRS